MDKFFEALNKYWGWLVVLGAMIGSGGTALAYYSTIMETDPLPLAGQERVTKLAQNFTAQQQAVQDLANTVKTIQTQQRTLEQRQDSDEAQRLLVMRSDLQDRLRVTPGDRLLRDMMGKIEARLLELSRRKSDN